MFGCATPKIGAVGNIYGPNEAYVVLCGAVLCGAALSGRSTGERRPLRGRFTHAVRMRHGQQGVAWTIYLVYLALRCGSKLMSLGALRVSTRWVSPGARNG